MPAYLRLELALPLRPGSRASGTQPHARGHSLQHAVWRPRAVAPAAAAREAPSPASTLRAARPRRTDALTPEQCRAFDEAVRTGHPDDALQVLAAAAAALPRGEPIPLLGPDRNRAMIQVRTWRLLIPAVE